MLQSNLIYGIQQKIKENKAVTEDGMLEEATVLEEAETEEVEPILESSFISGVYEKASHAKKKEEKRRVLVTETFNMTKIEKKLSKDVHYFNYLFENYVPEVFKSQYFELVESVLEDTIKLYQECDVTPRLFSQAVDSNELTEAMVVDIYKNGLNENIKNKYTKPLLSGKITELYESEIRDLTRKLIEEGSSIDPEQVKIYLPFEESVYRFNRSILIPETAEKPIQTFIESMDEEYKQFLQESPEEMLQNLEKKIRLLTSLVSPEMFNKAVEADGVDAPKMAGISITIDKNFDGDEDCDDGACPDDVASMDPEAAEEMADEEEAESLEAETEDVPGTEEVVRDEMELATDTEDLEDPEADEEAEESAEEETAEHPEQPGAVEMELDVSEPNMTPDGTATNDSDVELSGDGEETGVGPNDDEAQLPGNGVEGSGEEVSSDPDDLDLDPDEKEEDIENKEDVSAETPEEEEEEKEDVSEDEDKE